MARAQGRPGAPARRRRRPGGPEGARRRPARQQLAQEVREYIIDTVGEIGGHFGANLGTCELAVALHSLLDSPRDKILWDVGHQAYPHKVLTGRRDRLPTIRQYGGLAPFCSREESEHDIMGAGHASTAASYAVGIKEAMRKRVSSGIAPDTDEPEPRVVAVVGDGAMTGGVNFEALLNAGGLETPIVIVLNDNGMSISPNVGALSRYFNRLRLNPRGYQAREAVEAGLTRLPAGIGTRIERLGPQLKESLKAFWAPGLFFEELDLAYMGVDRRARREGAAPRAGPGPERRPARGGPHQDRQGQGLRAGGGGRARGHGEVARRQAEVDRERARRGRARSRPAKAAASPPQYTEVFGRALVEEARRDPRVIGITAAMAGGTGLSMLAEELPGPVLRRRDRRAARRAVRGRAGARGMKPVAAIYSTFLQRGYDQIVARRLPAEAERRVLHGPRRAGRRRRPDAPRQLRHLLPAAAPEHRRDGAARRGACSIHMLRTALAHDGPVAHPLPAWRRGRRAAARREPAPIEIGTRRDARPGRAGGAGRLRDRVQLALDAAAALRDAGSPDRLRRSLRQAARRRAVALAGGGARTARDGRGERARRRLRLGGAGASVDSGTLAAGPP